MILETDYLVVGAGAMGMAFADTIIKEQPNSNITLVDQRSAPGGHWLDAYPYVRLHQPASFYGVNSEKLETAAAIFHQSKKYWPIILEFFTEWKILAEYDFWDDGAHGNGRCDQSLIPIKK